jgi:hypothetical protein
VDNTIHDSLFSFRDALPYDGGAFEGKTCHKRATKGLKKSARAERVNY